MDNDIKNILAQLKDHESRIGALEAKRFLPKKMNAHNGDENSAQDIVLQIANKATDCDESAAMQEKALDGNVEARILLCYYVAHKYFDRAWLTSGDIERITAELGVKVKTSNASSKIKESLRSYLESGITRRNGRPTPYRLNRNGERYFESILHG